MMRACRWIAAAAHGGIGLPAHTSTARRVVPANMRSAQSVKK
jgi:hypothetical protein